MLSVRDAITREEVDQININLRVDLFLQEDAIFSGVIESASNTPMDLDLNCELRQDREWQRDVKVGNFDCSTLAMQQAHHFYESNLPAAKFGDGKYFTEFTYNVTTLGQTPSGVLLQSWAESRDDPVSHFLMAAACRRSQAVSKTRLTITASGLGCP